LRFTGIISALLILSLTQAKAADVSQQFRRGIAISHTMAWAAIEPGPSKKFVFPPVSEARIAETAGELRTLRRSGFDFVRLAVDPGPFLQFRGAERDALDRLLIDYVKLVLRSDLSVIVDFHPSDMHSDYTADRLTAGLSTPAFQAYLGLIDRTAELLGGLHSGKVALEPMNEPPQLPTAWQPMLDAAYEAARRRSPDLILVLEGGDEASADGLMGIRTSRFAADPAALLAFHYYDPYQFTHQGASWNAARYLTDVPYPALARPLDDSLAAMAATIAATDLPEDKKQLAYRDAVQQLEKYRRSGFDGATMLKRFAQIADWAHSQGIPNQRILLGEFGAKRATLQFAGDRADERSHWFHDVSEAPKANSSAWAVWTYRGEGGFGLTPDATDMAVDPAIMAALGLDTRPQHKAAATPPTQASVSER
jgi:endoglucanase